MALEEGCWAWLVSGAAKAKTKTNLRIILPSLKLPRDSTSCMLLTAGSGRPFPLASFGVDPAKKRLALRFVYFIIRGLPSILATVHEARTRVLRHYRTSTYRCVFRLPKWPWLQTAAGSCPAARSSCGRDSSAWRYEARPVGATCFDGNAGYQNGSARLRRHVVRHGTGCVVRCS